MGVCLWKDEHVGHIVTVGLIGGTRGFRLLWLGKILWARAIIGTRIAARAGLRSSIR